MRETPANCSGPTSGRAERFALCAMALTAQCWLQSTQALAIPSPELVIGSVSSVSQIGAVVTAALGGGAVIVGARSSWARTQARSLRRARIFATCLLLTCVAAIAGNLYQWLDYRTERLARLEATLLRPAVTPGMPKLDPTLKELSFAQQLTHPLAMSTEEADALLAAQARGERADVVFLDVRETAETEMGTLPGAHAIRFPDFSPALLDLEGKQTVLFCHNGNRSFETCEALKALGIPCRFIVGGLEKWVVEHRRMTGLATRTLSELRAIPPYPNQRTLLETKTVHDLIAREKAIFVDVRYPGEFAGGHLPGAINLSIRRLPTPALRAEIERLPKRPIILPCYDRRGCFFAEVLGLELTKSGHDVRGRYTVPFEYFEAKGRPPHVEQWIAQNNRSLWNKAGDLAAALVTWLAGWLGLPAAVLVMAVLSRLTVLPFSLKAERDQAKATELAAEMAQLKARLQHDPQRLVRAVRAFHRRHGLTPVRNLLALAFLPIMALAVGGVHNASSAQPVAWLWLPDLAARDPLFVLPALFGILVGGYLHLSLARTWRQRTLVWAVGMPAMAAVAALLSAAVDLYLVISAVLLLAQRTLLGFRLTSVPRGWRRARSKLHHLRLPEGVITLDESARLAASGSKAYRLAQLRAHGVAVPAGLVLTPAFLEGFSAATPECRQRTLDRLWHGLGAVPLAVRSSAAAEDGASSSFAGVFHTELNVHRAGLDEAIRKVHESFTTARSVHYGGERHEGNVLLQRMADAEFAGVLFTSDPASAGAALVEMSSGHAERLVGGSITPSAYRFGRHSLAPLSTAKPPIDLGPLLALGQFAERLFGRPQDIEWTYGNGRFHIVQSRDITRGFSAGQHDNVLQEEWDRILSIASSASRDEVVFAQNEMSEMLPRPTPLSLSLIEGFWAAGGSIDLACRRLGLEYKVDEWAPAYFQTIAGRLYVDKRQELARRISARRAAVRRIEKSADQIASAFTQEFLPEFLKRQELLSAVEFERMPLGDLVSAVARLHEDFMLQTHVEVDVINIAAGIYFEQARTRLARRGLDPVPYLGRLQRSGSSQELVRAAQASGDERFRILKASHGHRASFDYELAQARYGEEETGMDALRAFCESALTPQPAENPPATGDRALDAAIGRARRFQVLKEDAKHTSLRELAVLRRAVLALDRRLGLHGLTFHLTFGELLAHRDNSALELRTIASQRQERAQSLAQLPQLPSTLTLHSLEQIAAQGRVDVHGAALSGTRGTRIAGSGVREGRARVLSPAEAERGEPIAGFERGDIIVSRTIHPNWLAHLRMCAGLVCELGGWLSHMAVLARELDIAMVVGVQEVGAIPDRALLRLYEDGAIEVIGSAESESIMAEAAE